jgi:hypothetical protein
VVILIFNYLNNTDVISATFQIASYTYGPLLGLFAYGIYSKNKVHDKLVPFVCLAAPVLTFAVVWYVEKYGGYKFGFENLLLNGLFTIIGLYLLKREEPAVQKAA